MFDNQYFAQQGWQCPICKRVYSPTTPMCYYCGNQGTVTTNTTTVTVPGPEQSQEDCWEMEPVLLTSYPPKYKWICKYCGKELVSSDDVRPEFNCECRSSNKKGTNHE